MSANIILDVSEVKPQCSGRFWNLTVDNEFNASFPVANIRPGLPGQYLATSTGPSVSWSDLPTQPVLPGPANSVLQTNTLGTATVWNTDVTVPGIITVNGASFLEGNVVSEVDHSVVNDFYVLNGDATIAQGDLEVTQGTFKVLLDDTTLANTRVMGNCIVDGSCNLNGNAQIAGQLNLLDVVKFNGTGPLTNQVPVCTAPGVIEWTLPDIPFNIITPGLARQVLQTNAAGTEPEWTSSLNLGGTLEVTGTTQLDSNLIVSGNIRVNGTDGSVGDVIVKTGAATQAWGKLPVASVVIGSANQTLMVNSAGTLSEWRTLPITRACRFTAFLTAQDLNLSSSLIVNYEGTPQYSYTSASVGTFKAIILSSATQFTFDGAGYYDLDVNIYFDQSSGGIGNSFIRISVNVGGVTQKPAIVSGDRNIVGRIPNILVTASQVVYLQVVRITGVNPLNTYGSGGAAPLYASTVSWTLVNTVV